MSTGTLDPDNLPIDTDRTMPPGHAARSVGRSDSSDSGSDLIGDGNPDDDTSDRAGTDPDSLCERSVIRGLEIPGELAPELETRADIWWW